MRSRFLGRHRKANWTCRHPQRSNIMERSIYSERCRSRQDEPARQQERGGVERERHPSSARVWPVSAKTFRHLTVVGLLLGAIVLFFVGRVAFEQATDNDADTEAVVRTFAFLAALWGLVLATLILSYLGASVWGLIAGADNRLSTSKVQAVIWTYAVVGALAVLLILYLVGDSQGLDVLIGAEPVLDDAGEPALNAAGEPVDPFPQTYLLLLGGPFAAAVAAKAIVSSKVGDGTLNKSEGDPDAGVSERLSQAVSDDAGNADLVDTQYLFFNLILLGFFLTLFIEDPRHGLPELPDVLVGLTSLGALTYVTSKAVAKAQPTLSSVSPNEIEPEGKVTLRGQNLLLKRPGVDPTGQLTQFENLTIQAGGTDLTPDANTTASSVGGVDTIKDVPLRADLSGKVAIRVLTERGIPTEPIEISIVEPEIRFVSPSTIKPGDTLRIFGRHLAGSGSEAGIVEWGGRPIEVSPGSDDDQVHITLPAGDLGQGPIDVSVINSFGQRSEPHPVQVAGT